MVPARTLPSAWKFAKPNPEAGVNARSAVGVASLPLDAPVEVEMIVEIAG